jgi:serine/threonine-protein kinase RsbW
VRQLPLDSPETRKLCYLYVQVLREAELSNGNGNTESANGYWPLDRSAYSIRRRAAFPSTRQSINDACAWIVDAARACGYSTDQEPDLEIAMREALANAVIHGNREGRDKHVFVRCYGGDDKMLLVLIRDEGPGFEPDGVPDPRTNDRVQLDHGRGLFLMRALMDHVEYRKRGSEVLLFKRW